MRRVLTLLSSVAGLALSEPASAQPLEKDPESPASSSRQENAAPGHGEPEDEQTDARPFGYARQVGAPESDAEFSDVCRGLCFVHVYGTVMAGRGLRFNNPFRLQTQLGDSAESLSLTAPYSELSFAGLLGDPFGLQQGAHLGFSFAMYGVPQQVLSPGYAALYRLGPRWQLRGRAALPIVLQPDLNLGVDLGVGAAFMVLSGVGIAADSIISFYQGAGTDQRRATLIPVWSLQAGLTADLEVLP